MIDLHNHILPGVDDGAADLDESVAIARQFVSEGVTRIAATPHLDPLNNRGAEASTMVGLVRMVQGMLNVEGVPLQISPGQEIYLTPDLPELLAAGAAVPLADGPWVLVELPFSQRPLYADDTMFRVEVAGYRVILAHPERYSWVQRDPSAVIEIVERGIALQLTAPALLGEYGSIVRRVAETLLRMNLYALASSDRHHPGQRRSLSDLRDRVIELAGREMADLLLRDNSARVVAGEDIVRPEVRREERRSLFGRLFGR